MGDELDRRVLLGTVGLAGVAALAASRAGAGPLSPPAGAVGSTGKTLGEMEPRIAVNAVNTPATAEADFTAPAAGSYYLTGDITVPAGRTGVFLPEGSTLDLNGFTVATPNTGSVGIRARSRCTVRNGRLTGRSAGVAMQQQCVLEDVSFDPEPASPGAVAATLGGSSVVRRCIFLGGSATHVSLGGGVVEDCQFVFAAGGPAISSGFATIVRGCIFSYCASGVSVGAGSRVEGCIVDGFDVAGIQVGTRSHVEACTVGGVGGGGGSGAGRCIVLGAGSTASRCVLASQLTGVSAAGGCRITDCSFDGHTGPAVKIAGSGSIVDNCAFTRNATGVDMQNVGGNYVHRCVMLGTANPIAVNVGGNWYPNVALGSVNAATNPLASVFG